MIVPHANSENSCALRALHESAARVPGRSRHDPRKLLSRSEAPIFAPETEWEKVGQVPSVVFVEGMVQKKDRFYFYYGAADKYVGVAQAPAISRGTDTAH